ncbi:hypothetical protein K438DRAFT_1988503 [Mycena galopus ATCC 62051]|nr:hypothetical protein K438DRAFT_1988503 [Mycena galopus ATCC 62051]
MPNPTIKQIAARQMDWAAVLNQLNKAGVRKEYDNDYIEYSRSQLQYKDEEDPAQCRTQYETDDNPAQHPAQSRDSPVPNSEAAPQDSDYHNGQGINYVIAFQPQLPPLKPGQKPRSNAHAPILKHSIYVHEDSSLSEVFDAAITTVGHNERTMRF